MWEFILQPEIFKALVSVLALIVVAVLAWKGRKYAIYGRIVFQIWHLVEKSGAVNDWQGYEKLAIAMGALQERFFKEFGREPSAKEEGWAVKLFTWLCNIEGKGELEDLSEE